jgi:type 1 glutamine amidotransferase
MALSLRGHSRPSQRAEDPHYKARNVYFQFGHKPDLFQNGAFKALFLNAIRWASER